MKKNTLTNYLCATISAASLMLGWTASLNGQSPSIDGRVWVNSASGTTINLKSVSVYGSDFAVAVGTDGTVLRYSNGAWSPFPGATAPWGDPPTDLSAVAVYSPNSIWVGSASSTTALRGVSHWNGTTWGPNTIPANTANRQRVNDLWVDPVSGYVFTALQSGRVSYYNGFEWSNLIVPGGSGDMLSVHGTGLDNIWAVGSSGQVYQSTNGGISWTVHNLGEDYGSVNWNGVYTLGQDRAWLVGNGGQIAFWNGADFSVVQPTSQVLRDVYAIDENHVYVVGSASGQNGTFLYFDGNNWRAVDLDPSVVQQTWYGIDGDGTRIWLVGNDGIILTSVIPEPSHVALAVIVLLPVLTRLMKRRRNGQGE